MTKAIFPLVTIALSGISLADHTSVLALICFAVGWFSLGVSMATWSMRLADRAVSR